jgi:Mrp family chromosome partitioning ATPase/capsular polysaccharide biosynthesis protein
MASRPLREYEDFAAGPRSVDLRDYWQALRRRWMTLGVAAVAGAALGAGYAAYKGPSYQATAQVLVTPVTQGPLNQPAQADQLVNMSTEQAVAQSGAVIAKASQILKLPVTKLQGQASSQLTITVPNLSDVLQMAWTGGSAQSAQRGADAFATAYLTYRHEVLTSQVAGIESVLRKQVTSLEHQITRVTDQLPAGPPRAAKLDQLNQQLAKANDNLLALPSYDTSGGRVIPASLPLKPTGLSRSVLVVLGALLGLLIGAVIALIRDALDDRLRDAAALERDLGAPTLAVLPGAKSKRSRGDDDRAAVALVMERGGQAAAAIRALRATLTAIAERDDLCTILIVDSDGTVSSSRITAELGIGLAESGRRVFLIAADLQGSSLPEIFEMPNTAGLTNFLARGGDVEAYTLQPKRAGGSWLPKGVAERLNVLPNGPRPAQPIPLLDSRHMTALLRSQRDVYAFVLLDSSPGGIGEVLSLAATVDGVLVTARQGRTRQHDLAEVRRQLDQVGAKVIGGLLIGRAAGRAKRAASSPPGTGTAPLSSGAPRPAERGPVREVNQQRRRPTAGRDMPGPRDMPAGRDVSGPRDIPGGRDTPGGRDIPGVRDGPGARDVPGSRDKPAGQQSGPREGVGIAEQQK